MWGEKKQGMSCTDRPAERGGKRGSRSSRVGVHVYLAALPPSLDRPTARGGGGGKELDMA